MKKRRNLIQRFLITNLIFLSLIVAAFIGVQVINGSFQSDLFSDTNAEETQATYQYTIAIITGHGTDTSGWYDSGAIAYDGSYEAELNDELAQNLADDLASLGVKSDIIDENVYRNIMYYNTPYDFTQYDFVIELHFNASNSGTFTGTEVIYNSYNKYDLSVHEAVASSLEAITGSSMVFEDDDFLTQKTIASQGIPSMLLETVYIDNAQDYALYLNNQALISRTIAQALLTLYE